jgi:hypothetical protein
MMKPEVILALILVTSLVVGFSTYNENMFKPVGQAVIKLAPPTTRPPTTTVPPATSPPTTTQPTTSPTPTPTPDCKDPTPQVCDGGCCQKGDQCCQKDAKANGVCCKSTDTCASALGVNYCKSTECSTGQYLCQGTRCCDNGQYCCGVIVPFCMSKGKECTGEFQVKCDGSAFCKDSGGNDPHDYGSVCCDSRYEECHERNGVKGCTRVKCPAEQTLCKGEGKFGPDPKAKPPFPGVNICCEKGKSCQHHPNGYPRCV